MTNENNRLHNIKFILSELEKEDQSDLAQMQELLVELEYLESEQSLYTYLISAWEYFDPAPFLNNWHLGAIAEHVQACLEGQIRDLMVNVPPRCAKSSLISLAAPTWEWGPAHRPETKFITASYGASLATRDSVRSRRLLNLSNGLSSCLVWILVSLN